MESKGPTVDPAVAVRNLRIVFSAILMGVLVFATVAPIIRPRVVAGMPLSRQVGMILVISAMAVTIILSVAAYMLAHAAAKPQSSTAAMQGEAPAAPQSVAAKLIVSAAMTEAAAVFSIVVYILVGFLPVLAIAVLAAVLGIALSFPRADLFVAAPVEPSDAVTYH